MSSGSKGMLIDFHPRCLLCRNKVLAIWPAIRLKHAADISPLMSLLLFRM